MNLKSLTMNNGLLRFRTCFSSISHSGYKLDILKSAMQKYLRRKEKSKMIWCVAEIYLFHVFAKSEQEKKATKGKVKYRLQSNKKKRKKIPFQKIKFIRPHRLINSCSDA